MRQENLIIHSICDNLPISVTVFEPEEEPKAVFQFSHGMAEHKERYYDFMKYLADHGYASVINDHRGHGDSVHSKNDWGYFYDDSADFIVEDLHQITNTIKEKFKGKPVYLFGHSMGSLVVRKYIKKYDSDIEKLVVCGSPSKNPMVGAALALVALQKAIKGDKHRSKFINNLAFGSYTKNIENPASESSWLSANEENVTVYEKDEACGFIFTLNGFKNLFTLMKEVYQPSGWRLQSKELPIFFIAGADDPVIVSEKAWKESQDFLKNLGYTDVSGKLYAGLRHEILNEKNAAEIYKDILQFAEE